NSRNLNAGGTITFTDVDLTDKHTVTFTADGNNYLGTFTPTLMHDATGGSTGNVGWTFSVSDKAVEFLAGGQTLTQTYTVIVTDINGASSTQLVTITIHGTNEAAGNGDPNVHDVTEDVNVVNGNLTAIGTISITDADQNQAAFQTSVTGAQGNLGSLTLQANGSYTYTVADSLVDFLGANDTKVDTFTVTALDG